MDTQKTQTTQRPVLVGVDGRPSTSGAVRYAVVEATRRRAPLALVHVVPPLLGVGPAVPMLELEDTGREVLKQELASVRELAPDLEVTSTLLRGDRSAGIVKEADSASLVVIGRETRRGVERLLTGTTTAGVAAHAPCDVVVVPWSWTGESPHGRVTVGLKTRKGSHVLLGHAFAAAAARGAALRVVTAWELGDPYLDRIEYRTHRDEWVAEGIRVVDELAAPWRSKYPDVALEARVLHGGPVEVLLEAGSDSDLLLISRRRFPWPPYGHLGGVGHALLRVSEVPVHVVPYRTEQPEDEPLVLETDGRVLK